MLANYRKHIRVSSTKTNWLEMFLKIITVVAAHAAIIAVRTERLKKFNDKVQWCMDCSFVF
jgi:hypothetical protein